MLLSRQLSKLTCLHPNISQHETAKKIYNYMRLEGIRKLHMVNYYQMRSLLNILRIEIKL